MQSKKHRGVDIYVQWPNFFLWEQRIHLQGSCSLLSEVFWAIIGLQILHVLFYCNYYYYYYQEPIFRFQEGNHDLNTFSISCKKGMYECGVLLTARGRGPMRSRTWSQRLCIQVISAGGIGCWSIPNLWHEGSVLRTKEYNSKFDHKKKVGCVQNEKMKNEKQCQVRRNR